MEKRLPSINLLKDEKKFFDKLIFWSLSIGRIIVILTELVALSAFLFRFSLDKRLIDIHDANKQKGAILALLKKDEDTYSDLQKRLQIASMFLHISGESVRLLTDIKNLPPHDVLLTKIVLSETSLSIDAHTQSVFSLSRFINSLKQYPRSESVVLSRIEDRTTSGTIIASITINLKK